MVESSKTRPVDNVYKDRTSSCKIIKLFDAYFICVIKKYLFFAIMFSSTCQKPMDYLFDQVASDQEFTE